MTPPMQREERSVSVEKRFAEILTKVLQNNCPLQEDEYSVDVGAALSSALTIDYVNRQSFKKSSESKRIRTIKELFTKHPAIRKWAENLLRDPLGENELLRQLLYARQAKRVTSLK